FPTHVGTRYRATLHPELILLSPIGAVFSRCDLPDSCRDAIPGYATPRTYFTFSYRGRFLPVRPSRLMSGRDTGLRYTPNLFYFLLSGPFSPVSTLPTHVGPRYRAALQPVLILVS